MEELENISRNQISEDIFGKITGASNSALDVNHELSNTVPRPSYRNKPRPISEISSIISRRHELYKHDFDVYKRQFNIRPPDEVMSESTAWKSMKRERPLSEIAVPNEWKRNTWEVSAIDKLPAPPEDKPIRRRPRPQYAKFEIEEPDELIRAKRTRSTEQRSETAPTQSVSKSDTLSQSLYLPLTEDDSSSSRKRENRKRSRKKQLSVKELDHMSSEEDHPVWNSYMVAPAELSAPGWGSRTLDVRFLEQAAREILDLENVVCFKNIYFSIKQMF